MEKGASFKDCCKTIEISENTLRAWSKKIEGDKRNLKTGRIPANKLSEEEEEKVREKVYSKEFADESPHKICETLLERGEYICSASTMYRILRKDEASGRRTQNRKSDEARVKPCIISTRPMQVFNWDITFLRTTVNNFFFKVLFILDMYTKEIVGYNVMEADSLENNLNFIVNLLTEKNIKTLEILHGDNGSTLKAIKLEDALRNFGVLKTYSRPHVSNDNPYIESFFGTMKTNIKYPKEGFGTKAEALSIAE